MNISRLLYLGFAFPPGLQERHPELNPAGHAFEVQMISELRRHFDLRTVGLLPVRAGSELSSAKAGSGVAHHLVLDESPPKLISRYRSLINLRRAFASWRAGGWTPDAVLTYNLSPVYNAFIRGLPRSGPVIKRVLLLLDSAQLGRPLSRSKRWRYRFKPMIVPDAEMLSSFDAAIGLSQATARYFTPRRVPFLWMPGGCSPTRAQVRTENPDSTRDEASEEPIRFGYFGALAAHSGARELIDVFRSTSVTASLHVCGYGRLSTEIQQAAAGEPRLKFHGLLPTADDCLRFGQSCDVLVNPRPDSHGNGNNFPSKVFEYALCRRAILSTRLSGVDAVLGEQAFYFGTERFKEELAEQLSRIASLSRRELRARGATLQERICREFSWPKQAARMAEFIRKL